VKPNSANTGKRRRNRARGTDTPPELTKEQRQECEATLGYKFKDSAQLDRAMTHRSAAQGKTTAWSNERLEFLGDRILALVIVETLLERFPAAREGELAPRLNALVSRETCAHIGAELGLGRFLIVDRSERATGGTSKPTLLANAAEAVIGAIYVDGGLKPAEKFILKHWAQMLKANEIRPRDPKSALQEFVQGAGLPAPSYRHDSRDGPDHAPCLHRHCPCARSRADSGHRRLQAGRRTRSGARDAAIDRRPFVIIDTKSGFAAIIGAPNAGKSTLVNRLVGSKVSIVTHKVQTTRFPVRGVMMRGDAQVVLVDTPGIFAPKRRLDRAMVRSAWEGAMDADAVVHLVDARGWTSEGASSHEGRAEDEAIIARLKELGSKAVLALNKIDLVDRPALLRATKALFDTGAYSDVLMISGLNGDGVDQLADLLAAKMPTGPYLFPADQAADIPIRLLAAEVTREKLMLRLHQEIPYQLTVETETWEQHKNGSVKIEQMIHVGREGHRSIVLGKGGATIKEIGMASRKELADIIGKPVHLFLRVKVSERWQEARERYSALGLEFDV
jgi:GTPase